ncbi:hypothetical protein AX15_004310 [Amanita polypyramis BW_CC]|nr:hypothetical protein AX15_004310 [Amanita polypyramis BW_CC]
MFSLFLRERLYIGEACWAFIFGVIIGPYCANIFDPRSWGGGSDATLNTITLEFTRVVLAIGVFAIGVELPKAYMSRHWKSLFFLLVPVMTWGWFVSAGLIFALIPGLNFLGSLAVAACLTPTDPILAAAVVGGKWADKHVPAHIRHLLAAESGCNDGAAFPFLYISLYLILDATTHSAVRDWFLLLWLYQIIFGTVIGVLLGFGFRHLMKFCQRHDLIDRHSYVAQYVSLAMLTIGVCTLLGADDLLASFACGTAFAWDGFFKRQTEESVFSSVIDLLFNVAAFVFVGAWMPFSKFSDATLTLSVWRLIVVAILVLLLKRLPVVVLLYRWIPDVKTFREAVFSGHFGPIGIGAVFISTLASQIIRDTHVEKAQSHHTQILADTIQPIVAFMVLCSIVIHGLSIPSFSLGKRVHSVSRTWSRHASGPDWTNQARLVERGADIVINRDSTMEEGNLPSDEKFAASPKRPSTGSSATTLKKLPIDEISLAKEELEQVAQDGTEKVEWQEPHHKIIEKREGSGEDIEVEVRDEDDLKRRSSGWSVTGRAVHAVADAATHITADIKKVGQAVGHEANAIKDMLKEAEHGGKSISDLQKQGKVSEVEEDWSSDYSNDDTQPTSSSATPQQLSDSDTREKTKTTKTKGTGPRTGMFASLRKGKRNSLRRICSQPQNLVNRPSDDDDRGRSGGSTESSANLHHPSATWHHKRGSSAPKYSLGEGYPRNQRINTIRALSSARDESPSRSVRFIDDDGSRPGSAHRSLAVSQVDVTLREEDESETPRSRTVFVSREGLSGGTNGKSGNGGGAGGINVRS